MADDPNQSPPPEDSGAEGAPTDSADTGTSETGTSDTGTSETGTSETGTSETGTSETGTSETGAPSGPSLDEQLGQAHDRVLRLQAELQNTRKRLERENAEIVRYALMPLLRDLLPLIDNLSFGTQAAEKSVTFTESQVREFLAAFGARVAAGEIGPENLSEAAADFVSGKHDSADKSLLDGFKMLGQQLIGALQRHGCKRIEALGQPFDPNLHQAVTQMSSPDHPPMTVLHEARPGFVLHERVVRPAEVVVSSAPPEGEKTTS